MISKEQRDELRSLAKNASDGPWEVSLDRLTVRTKDATVVARASPSTACALTMIRNAEFVAASRTAVPALLDALDEAETRTELAEDALKTPLLDAQTAVLGELQALAERAEKAEARADALLKVAEAARECLPYLVLEERPRGRLRMLVLRNELEAAEARGALPKREW